MRVAGTFNREVLKALRTHRGAVVPAPVQALPIRIPTLIADRAWAMIVRGSDSASSPARLRDNDLDGLADSVPVAAALAGAVSLY